MKKIISSILIVITVLQIFAPFSVGLNNNKLNLEVNKAEAADCTVNSISFSPIGGQTENTKVSLPSSITATVKTQNCAGKKVIFQVLESFNWEDDEVLQESLNVVDNTFTLKLFPTELKCGDKDLCGFKYRTATENNSFSWKELSNKKVDGFYKCTTKDSKGKLCANQSPWYSEVTSGAYKASSVKPDVNFKITMSGKVTNTDKTATANISITDKTDYNNLGAGVTTYSYYVNLFLKNESGTIISNKRIFYDKKITGTIDPIIFDITPSTKYIIDGSIDIVSSTTISGGSGGSSTSSKEYKEVAKLDQSLSFISNTSGDQTVKDVGNIGASAENVINKNQGNLPACGLGILGSEGTPIGCLAQGLYYLIFVPTSFLFALTGKALDFTLMYSISDSSYRSTFVTEGWGIMRDFCNMFFIFVLLYIAFGTILNLSGVKTKEMIINVVIIGVLLNFSLFATQIIIDTSNILTRVFYNQNTIATGSATKDADGNVTNINNSLGDLGEIKLSEAIVSKVDPQKLVMNATKINQIPIRGKTTDEAPTTEGGLTTGSYILVILLSSAINIFGMIAFLSCAIIFISRVVGLWIAIILAPLAFFSYTVPKLQGMKMVGWKHWWPDTLSLAFLAPVFAFFMYIIVGFMNKGLDVINADSKTGLNFVIAIMVPFIFIMILLMKAKDIAKDMSGELGKSITNGISAAGGIALGAAAGGAALLGRKVVGAGIAKMSRGETSTQKYEAARHAMSAAGGHDTSYMRNLGTLDRIKGSVGSKLGLGKVYGKADGTFNARAGTGDKTIKSGLGGLLNKKQVEVGAIDLARHKQDETKKASGLEGVENANLSGENIKTMENKYKQSESGNIESQFKKGVDGKGNVLSMTDTAGNAYTGENDFKARNRSRIEADLITANAPGDVIGGILSPSGRKKLEDELSKQLNTVVKANVDVKIKADFEKMMKEASTHVNQATRSFSGANKNSYDIRKISDMTTDKRESFLTKGGVGLAALIATGVRSGIRGSGFGNSQLKVEGDFMKDLGTTISDSLKSMKINVNIKGVGGHKSSADSHGGGH